MSALVNLSGAAATMSSREIAELTGKQHKDVLENIRKVLDEAGISWAEFSAQYKDTTGRMLPCFNLPKRECDLVIAGYSVKYRLAIIDRWQELENKQAFQIPQTLSGALMLAAQQAEQIEQLQMQAKNDAPKVQFAEAVRKIDGSCKIEHFSKTLQIGRNTFFKMLKADGILMPDRMPYQRYIDNGFFVVIEQIPYTDKDGRTHPTFTTMVTGKGQVWLEKKYRAAVQERQAA